MENRANPCLVEQRKLPPDRQLSLFLPIFFLWQIYYSIKKMKNWNDFTYNFLKILSLTFLST